MADVFISYSFRDKLTADAICARLEGRGIRCWIAPRDILPSQTWAGAIVTAIQACSVFVLVFSTHSNSSSDVLREVQSAAEAEKPILPFRIENAPASPDMQYYLGIPHWLDALTPPLEQHIEKLAQAVARVLAGDTAAGAVTLAGQGAPLTEAPSDAPPASTSAPPPAGVASPTPPADSTQAAGGAARGPVDRAALRRRRRRVLGITVPLAAVVLVLAVGLAILQRNGGLGLSVRPAFRPPITAREVDDMRLEVLELANACMQNPAAVAGRQTQLAQLAAKVEANPRYGEEAPGETAALYRMYTASLLFAPKERPTDAKLRRGLAALRKLRAINPSVTTNQDLLVCEKYFTKLADGTSASYDAYGATRHVVKLALLGSADDKIDEYTRQIVDRAAKENVYQIDVNP